ncbi:MAG TPA: amidohydrolase family protein, partial [Amaricoccus sp.]|nr:amidohydrolase family protein [Amaricoccus sp.]
VRVGTLNGAVYLGRDHDVGSIQVGKRADLILIDGDAAADPAALDRIVTVFKAGVGYDRQALLDLARGQVGYR